MRQLSLLFSLLIVPAVVTGCGAGPEAGPGAGVSESSSALVRGSVFGGQQPVSGATVTVWRAGTAAYGAGATSLATTTSGANGGFSFAAGAYTCAQANAPTYITAAGGNSGSGTNANLVMAAGLGACSVAKNTTVNINEVSTAATAFALGQFFTKTLGGAATTDSIGAPAANTNVFNVGLVQADSVTVPMLISLAGGTVNAATATTTIEATKIYSIANTLASCINTTGQTSTSETTTNCGKLFNLTTPPGGTRPLDTLQAAVQMSLYPYRNVAALFNLGASVPPFVGLSAAPNDWTVGVAYKSTSLGLGINGAATLRTSSNLDIDSSGRIWFPTNAAAAHGVAYFDPLSSTFNGPYSTGLVHPQYVAIDFGGLVWATDQNSSALTSNSTSSPTAAGTPFAVPSSVNGGPLTIDLDNAVLFFYNAGGSPFQLGVYSGGTLTPYAGFTYTATGLVNERVEFGPGGAGDYPRHVYSVTSQGGGGVCALEETSVSSANTTSDNASNSGVANCFSGGGAIATAGFDEIFSVTTSNQLFEAFSTQLFTPTVPLSGPEGIATDGKGNEWIANSGNASVSTVGYNGGTAGDATDFTTTSTIAYLHDSTHGNTMTTPYGIGVDRSGNVWVSNASCVTTTTTACTPSGFTLTELIGAAAPTITPLSAQGIGTGTLPTNDGRTPVERLAAPRKMVR